MQLAHPAGNDKRIAALAVEFKDVEVAKAGGSNLGRIHPGIEQSDQKIFVQKRRLPQYTKQFRALHIIQTVAFQKE